MNYCDAHKLVWFAPVRTATRATGDVMRQLGFVNGVTGKPFTEAGHTHELRVPPGKADYTVLVSVRNPYARMASVYRWLEVIGGRPDIPFGEWLRTGQANQPYITGVDKMVAKAVKPGQPVHLLHTESLEDDLLAVPAIARDYRDCPSVRIAFDRSIRTNRYKDVASFQPLYDEDAVRVVRVACAGQFEEFGYMPEFPGGLE